MKDTLGGPAIRILVIEDNLSDVILLERALRIHDVRFEMLHMLDGREAMDFIHRDGAYREAPDPNLILVDLNLSKYSGEDIVREIRSARHLEGIPVCVWSSSRSWRDELVLKEIGVSRFITKPSGLDQFIEIGKLLKAVLAERSAG